MPTTATDELPAQQAQGLAGASTRAGDPSAAAGVVPGTGEPLYHSHGHGPMGATGRLHAWLDKLPAPVSLEDRYRAGLVPGMDHPLHPHPLRANRPLAGLEPAGGGGPVGGEGPQRASTPKPAERAAKGYGALQNPNKRQRSEEDQTEAADQHQAKRARVPDSIRRLSQRFSSALTFSRPTAAAPPSPAAAAAANEPQPQQQHHPHHNHQFGFEFHPQLKLDSNNNNNNHHHQRRNDSLPAMFDAVRNGARRVFSKSGEQPPNVPAPLKIGRPKPFSADVLINVGVIGDGNVGKTALIKRFNKAGFSEEYEPTTIRQSSVDTVIDNVKVQATFFEEGSGRLPQQREALAMTWCSVVLVCFDLSDRMTLPSVLPLRNYAKTHAENATLIMVGMKKDKRHNLKRLHLSFLDEPDEVNYAQGRNMSVYVGCDRYMECSARSGENVDELLELILRSGMEVQKTMDKRMAKSRRQYQVQKRVDKFEGKVKSLFHRGD